MTRNPQTETGVPTIRLMLVDDHPIVRIGLAALIGSLPGMEAVAQAGTGREAIDLHRQHLPDVTLMDLRLPDIGGVETIRTIRAATPDARFIVLTTYEGDEDNLVALATHATCDTRSEASAVPASPIPRVVPRCDPAAAHTGSSTAPRPAACRPCARSAETRPIRAQHLLSGRQAGVPAGCSLSRGVEAPAVFSYDRFQRLAAQAKLSHQHLQTPVLVFQRTQPLRFGHVHTAELRLPLVERRRTPCSRQRSAVFTPDSCCFKTPMICSSLNRLFFIATLPRLQSITRELQF